MSPPEEAHFESRRVQRLTLPNLTRLVLLRLNS